MFLPHDVGFQPVPMFSRANFENANFLKEQCHLLNEEITKNHFCIDGNVKHNGLVLLTIIIAPLVHNN